MKNILLILTFLLSFTSFSQTYPRFETDSNGKKVVIITYEQAQKIDNAFEMLKLLEKAGSECDSLTLSYVKVIDEQKGQITLLSADVTLYKNQIVDKDGQISNLKQRLSNSEDDAKHCDEQIVVKEKQITLLENEITTLKTKRNVAYGVGVAGIIGGILLVLILH